MKQRGSSKRGIKDVCIKVQTDRRDKPDSVFNTNKCISSPVPGETLISRGRGYTMKTYILRMYTPVYVQGALVWSSYIRNDQEIDILASKSSMVVSVVAYIQQ